MKKDGENIRRLRQGLGLSQEAFGDIIGVSKSTVDRIEDGESDLKVKHHKRLVDHFGNDVLALADISPTGRERPWLRAYLALHSSERDLVSMTVVGMIKGLHKLRRGPAHSQIHNN